MNGTIQPTVELATNNGNGFAYPVYPMMGGYGYGNNGGFFGGDGIWAIVLIALLFSGRNGFFGGYGGGDNVATTDFVSNEFTQRDISNGFQNQSNLISNGFSNIAQDICGVKSEVLENRYANQLAECQTQRDLLNQTNQLNTNLLTTQLNAQAQLDNCCCQIRQEGLANTQRILDAIQNNTIQDLRDRLAAANDIISDERTTNNVINSLRPYPTPAYIVSSPYQSIYNGFGWNGGCNGNFYGTNI